MIFRHRQSYSSSSGSGQRRSVSSTSGLIAEQEEEEEEEASFLSGGPGEVGSATLERGEKNPGVCEGRMDTDPRGCEVGCRDLARL